MFFFHWDKIIRKHIRKFLSIPYLETPVSIQNLNIYFHPEFQGINLPYGWPRALSYAVKGPLWTIHIAAFISAIIMGGWRSYMLVWETLPVGKIGSILSTCSPGSRKYLFLSNLDEAMMGCIFGPLGAVGRAIGRTQFVNLYCI